MTTTLRCRRLGRARTVESQMFDADASTSWVVSAANM